MGTSEMAARFSSESAPLSGVFSLNVPAEALFFVGNQLIATSNTGRVGVWNAVTKHWQVIAASCSMATGGI